MAERKAEQTAEQTTAGRRPSKRRWPRDFADRLTAPLPGFRDVLRMLRESRRMSKEGRLMVDGMVDGQLPARTSPRGGWRRQLRAGADQIRVSVQPDLPRAETGQTAVTWIGHATYVVQIGGLSVLTDPVWSRRIPGVPPRVTPAGLDWAALPPIDAVVISHNHYDHLDGPTVRRLPRDTPILVPAKLARWFRRRRFTDVTELDWWESRTIGEVTFDFVPAHHWSRRGFTDTNKTLWGGWVLSTGGSRVYFAGDTGYGHWFGEIATRYPGIDLALMPIGAYEPGWFMRPMHVDPEESVQAAVELGATRMATMHWGTFILSAEPLMEPVERAAKAWAAAGRAREHLWDLAVGETRTI
jgi:L-ascorbate metabolism protein UlaG (beta-lactamase superfamily)